MDTEQKTNYIFDNIVEADYDVQQFARFLATQPPNYTSNISQVTFKMLKQAVAKYIDNYKIPAYNKIEVNKTQNTNKLSKNVQSKNINMSSFNVDTNSSLIKILDCVKDENKFGLSDIQNQGKTFSRDYIAYKIQLPQLHKIIQRRYSDFQWLKKILQYYHPGIVIPPLPKKKMKKIFTPQHVKKKGRILQSFLRKCLEVPDLKTDNIIYRFLTIDQNKKFQQFKKQNQIDKHIISIQKIKTQTGKIQLGYNQQIITLVQKGSRYFSQISPLIKNIYKQIKRIKQNLDSCAYNFSILNTQCKKISEVDSHFKIFSQKKQDNYFQYLNILSDNYKQQLKIMSQLWQKQIYIQLKYQFHYSQVFQSQIKQYKLFEKEFYSKKQDIIKKKMKIYSKPITEWELNNEIQCKFKIIKPTFQQASPYLLQSKSQQFNKLQLKFGLFTKQLHNSIQNYRRNNNSHELKNFSSFMLKQYERQQKWQKKINQMMQTQFNLKNLQ